MPAYIRHAQRRKLQALGREAWPMRDAGETLRDIAVELESNPAQVLRALRAVGYRPATSVRHATRLEDGRKAVAMINIGLCFEDALRAIGGSRARLYRGMKDARELETDPMLL
jgi:hypothetical protein